MKYKLKIDELSSQEIELDYSVLWGKMKAFVHGKEIFKLKESGKPFPIPMPDGSTKKLYVKSSGFDLTPKIIVDGREILLARKLLWYEHVLALLPIYLLFLGGAIGGALAAVAIMTNHIVLRKDWVLGVRMLTVLEVTVLAHIGYSLVAGIIQAFIFPGNA